jgi:predicted NBD/HSP70 family sugar kinase
MSTGSNHAVKDAAYVVGVDLGGTKIRAGIASETGTILADRKVPTNAGGVNIIEQIVGLVSELCAVVGAGTEQVAATGIGGAGVPDSSGENFDQAPNLAGLRDVPFAQDLMRRLGHPVIIENDVNVAALGELHYGLGLGHSNFVFVSVGTGIGMGIVADGQLIRGASGAAGEIGYLPFGTDPLTAENQVRGPLEEAVAGDALARRYEAATGYRISTREIFAKAQDGDTHALAAIDDEARWLAAALVAVNAVLNPEVFVIGGGIGSRKELLPHLHAWLTRHGVSSLDIRISELGHRAPVAGAVRLALAAAKTGLPSPTETVSALTGPAQKGHTL